MDMKPLDVNAWIHELRHGGHRQTTVNLIDSNGCMCAIGVAGMLMLGSDGLREVVNACRYGDPYTQATGQEIYDTVRAAGIDVGAVWQDNDLRRISFEQIADRLERGIYALDGE
jgi:hypothetical protein